MDVPAFRAISLCNSYVEPVDMTKTSSGSFLMGLPRVVLLSGILESCSARPVLPLGRTVSVTALDDIANV